MKMFFRTMDNKLLTYKNICLNKANNSLFIDDRNKWITLAANISKLRKQTRKTYEALQD